MHMCTYKFGISKIDVGKALGKTTKQADFNSIQ